MNLPVRHLILSALLLATPASQAADSPWLSRLLLNTLSTLDLTSPGPTHAAAPSSALDYARAGDVDLNSTQHGQWQQEAGEAVWRLKLRSEDALSLSVTLSDMQLPAGATLNLYDGDGQRWHGPLSTDVLTRHARFWSPLVPRNALILELRVAASEQPNTQLRVSQVQHGFRDFTLLSKSGSCNIDVACSQADSWTDAVRASARITLGGQRLCSAVLLNNTQQNGDPLLLTARHCGVSANGEFAPSSVVVYWNFETSRCGGSPDGNLRQNQTGASLLADDAATDFTLLRLNQQPATNYQVYFAGWDARGLAPTSGASVHHPGGDEKRISLFNQAAAPRNANVDGQSVQSWQVFWSQGVTEPGSSGAGLWDAQHRVVGQLSGGNSSCSSPDGADVFGRLDVSWDNNSAAPRQLRAWLDPAGTGQLTLDGLDPSTNTLRAANDSFTSVPDDSAQLLLDVLSNDAGQQPLRLLSARAANGQVRVQGQQLLYDFGPGHNADQVEYQVINRWGEIDSANVTLERQSKALTPLRGGLVDGGALMLLGVLAAWRRRRCLQRSA